MSQVVSIKASTKTQMNVAIMGLTLHDCYKCGFACGSKYVFCCTSIKPTVCLCQILQNQCSIWKRSHVLGAISYNAIPRHNRSWRSTCIAINCKSITVNHYKTVRTYNNRWFTCKHILTNYFLATCLHTMFCSLSWKIFKG